MYNNPQPKFDADGGGDFSSKNRLKNQHRCCGPEWKTTALLLVNLSVLVLFVIFLFALYQNGPALDATTKATVGMRNDTVKLREDTEAALKSFRAHFPDNQEEVTTKQILDSIDKVHEIIVWADELKKQVPPSLVGSLIGNITTVAYNMNSMFLPPTASIETRQKRTNELIGSAALVVQKIGTLVNTITPAEFHAAFLRGQTAMEETTKLISTINHEKVSEIINKVSDILRAANSEHIIETITNTSKGLNEVIDRFTHNGGISISLPIGKGK